MNDSPPPPVIVAAGMLGTSLLDEYDMPQNTVWGMLEHDYARIALHPNDRRFEVRGPSRVRSGGIFDVPYKELVQELRYNLSESEDAPVPVFLFGYDWRQRLETIEERFAAFVEEVIERTCLLRHYGERYKDNNPKVNLVGHSMGGIIITGYLERKGPAAKVNKVVTLGTPFWGVFEAVIKVVTGTAELSPDPSSSREREAARMTPSLYYLIPTFDDCLKREDENLPSTLFDPRLWQRSVVRTIAEYVRLHGVSERDPDEQARELFAEFLADGRAHRERLDNFRLASAGLQPEDWLCVVGVNSKTRVRLRIKSGDDGPVFDLRSEERKNDWGQPGLDWRLTGDGTVPFPSAVPRFLDLANLVCVTPDDFGYFEVQDRLVSLVAGFHSILPNMDMLQRLIVRHFTGKLVYLTNTWGRPAPGVDRWDPPIHDLTPKGEAWW